ncbi:hypothetical protein TIFTF001_011500 [Ficus carica]|uniref:Uncharacterized protein n=1 Tax=Ficus carica TaxID=3494 RepID=A0AA88AE85_FICCA|nr:hypothetical protein TIFTF001_011500 [Ficus carica]
MGMGKSGGQVRFPARGRKWRRIYLSMHWSQTNPLMAFETLVWFELTKPLHSKSNLVYCATNPRQTVLGCYRNCSLPPDFSLLPRLIGDSLLQRFPAPWQPSPPAVWPPPTDYDFAPAAGNHPLRSPASRVAEEETEEETEPLEAPPFWAATALMGTRLRSLEEEEEIGGGGGHGDGVPNGDGGEGEDGRELGRILARSSTIRSGARNQIGQLRSCQSEAACEALMVTRLGDEYRQDGGGSCGDPPWKRDWRREIVRLERWPLLPRIGRGRDLCCNQLPPSRSPPRRRRGADLVTGMEA